VRVQVYNNNLTSSIWKSYTTNAANLRGSVALLANGLKTAQEQAPSEISLGQALRLKYRNISSAASETEGRINNLQTSDAWLQKAQTILEEMSTLMAGANEATQDGDQQAPLQDQMTMMRKELERIQSMQDGRLFIANTDPTTTANNPSELPSWFTALNDTALDPTTADGQGQITTAAGEGIANLAERRKNIGADIEQLEVILAELRSQVANIRATENQIHDPESAQTTTDAAKGAILTQVGTAMLAQANTLPGSVINLTTQAEE
jgi:flagellin